MRDDRKSKALDRVKNAENNAIDIESQFATRHADSMSIARYRALLDLEDGLSDRQKEFLAEFIQTGIVSRACLNVRMARHTHHKWLRESERYAEAFEDAKQMADEKLELLAYDLASGVYQKPIVDRGEIVTYEPIYDTKMLQTLLKARMPERFTDRKDITSNGHTIVKLVDREAWDSV